MAELNLVGDAINHLGVHLYQILAKTGGNVFISPASISMAMAMLFRGTKGSTMEEMRQVLGYDSVNLATEKVHEQCHDILTILNEPRDSYALTVANSLVHQKNFEILPDFKLDLEKLYQALVMEVDFENDSDGAVYQINEWVNTYTKNMIPKVVDSLDPATVIVLLNAVYFKGKWKHEFNSKYTQSIPFYNNGNKEDVSEVPMMFQQEKLLSIEHENFKVVELPYQGEDIAMLILLPNELDGIRRLEEHLTPNFVMNLRKDLKRVKVNLTLPKLHVEYSKQLKDVFIEIGLNSIFDVGCDLKGINEVEDLKVSEIIHKAVLDVNEEGTEAAAVTAVMVMKLSIVIEPIIEFKADHPFMLVIYHKRFESILFMGRAAAF